MSAQAAEGTPRAEAQQQQTVATPPGSASRKGSSFFQRLSPLLRKKEAGRESQEVRLLAPDVLNLACRASP